MAIDLTGEKRDRRKNLEKRKVKPHIGIAKFEKRRHPRFLLNLPIEYYRITPDLNYMGHTLNASKGGLMVSVAEQLEIGQYLRMKLFFSFGSDMNTVEMLSQVIWTSSLREDGSYHLGVKFVDISSDDVQRLENFLQKLYH